jgi:uracil-DNA glycosylase
MPDARKTLTVLNREWESCRACDLGVRREALKGAFVSGEGVRRGVMFIGEGPGENEEQQGRPFIGPSGTILRKMIQRLGLQEYYITNIVTCRSCSQLVDGQGQLRFHQRKSGPPIPIWKDEPPLPKQIASCLPRLYEEIYLVDPLVIVTLGVTASETILKRKIAITKERGQTEHASIPGATFRPSVTEKKGVWARKLHGVLEMPIERNEVLYEVVPTLHPAFVARKIEDKGWDSPVRLMFKDLKHAVKIYERYLLEAFGRLPTGASDVPDESIEEEQWFDEDEE